MKKSLPIIAVAAVIAVGIFLLIAQSSQKTTDNSSEPQTNSTMLDNDTANPDIEDSSESTEASACQTPPADSDTVSYCDGKFNDLTVPAGTVVTFRNDSDRVVQPSSDPHPQHTLNTELNVGFMNPGQTKTVTLTKKGTWSIHNHIRAEESAKITVQ